MGMDLAQFHEAFFEESFEAVESMEAALLKLDVGAPDPEVINTVFRVAHSIKGGAGMFNFADIASFTHTLETLLDGVRAGRTRLTTEVMNLLLKSVDVMREMLGATQRKQSFDPQRVADLQFDLEVAVAKTSAAQAPDVAAPPAAAAVSDWRIGVKPLENMLSRGNEPLALFAAVAELGELSVEASVGEIPPLASIDPHPATCAGSSACGARRRGSRSPRPSNGSRATVT